MNSRFIIPLLCAGALAYACGPRSRSDSGNLAVAQAVSVTSKPPANTKRGPAVKGPKLDARLTVDIEPQRVHFAFDIANVGSKNIELSFPNGRSYDLVVVDSLGREVWNWSTGRMFTQGVQNKQLGTGDSLRVSEAWPSLPEPGVYTAIATLNSSNYPVKERVEFVVP